MAAATLDMAERRTSAAPKLLSEIRDSGRRRNLPAYCKTFAARHMSLLKNIGTRGKLVPSNTGSRGRPARSSAFAERSMSVRDGGTCLFGGPERTVFLDTVVSINFEIE